MRALSTQFQMLLFVTALGAPSAFAMHAYGTDDCTAKTISGRELRISQASDALASPHQIVSESDVDNHDVRFESNLRILPSGLVLGEADVDAQNAKLVMKVLSSSAHRSKKIDEGCFVGEAKTTTRVVRVTSVAKEVADAYSIKAGETLTLSCYSDFSAPTGPKCDR